ncbi:PD-(D/E)XK nuclease domain-containing protein [Clostridium sp. MCC353]|uniref:PD-(D/E)XK nuclease domain-containing protein n=1 Tax=Clostridium sp. MCC353 TaxID=2592646 RepID=UPI00207984CC|nr:PD-(D/E)XK nuclease domain-containing protein [Clostridium sp. MCC353]
MKDYRILSNRELGNGRPDLILRTPSIRGRDVIIEIKAVGKLSDLEGGCEAALHQIEDKRYEASLKEEGYEMIIKYGICFYKKECLVRAGV